MSLSQWKFNTQDYLAKQNEVDACWAKIGIKRARVGKKMPNRVRLIKFVFPKLEIKCDIMKNNLIF